MTNPRGVPTRTALLAALVVLLLGALAILLLVGLHIGPFSDAPITTAAPSATPVAGSPRPSLPASGSPSTPGATAIATPPQVTPLGSPTTAYEALLRHVPAPLQAICTPADAIDDETVVVIAECVRADVTVRYIQYSSNETMAAAFDARLATAAIEPDTGSCEDHTTWPAESSYSVEGDVAGRRLCVDESGVPTIYWTDERLAILGQAYIGSDDYGRLVDFWSAEAGPVR